jgi:hypothetical protein
VKQKYFAILLGVFLVSIFLSAAVQTIAQDGDIPPGGDIPSQCPPGQSGTPPNCELANPAPGQLVSESNFGSLLIKIIKILLTFAGGIAVVFLMIGGFQYVMSRGNEEAMEKAKKGLTAAVIGLVLIVMAYAIVTMINTLLTKSPEEQGGTPPSNTSS